MAQPDLFFTVRIHSVGRKWASRISLVRGGEAHSSVMSPSFIDREEAARYATDWISERVAEADAQAMAAKKQEETMSESKDRPEKDAVDKIFERFNQQIEGRAQREYTLCRLNADDDGSFDAVIVSDALKDAVVVDFGKPVTWIGFPPEGVPGFIEQLAKHARRLSPTPLTIRLPADTIVLPQE